MRQLTQLELKRLTGQSTIEGQIMSLDYQKLPYTTRKLTGGYIIGVECYTSDIVPLLTTLQWDVILDENIGAGMNMLAEARKREREEKEASSGAASDSRAEELLGQAAKPAQRQAPREQTKPVAILAALSAKRGWFRFA